MDLIVRPFAVTLDRDVREAATFGGFCAPGAEFEIAALKASSFDLHPSRFLGSCL